MDYKTILFGTVLCAVILQADALDCYQCNSYGANNDCRPENVVASHSTSPCPSASQTRCYVTEYGGDAGTIQRGCFTESECDDFDCDGTGTNEVGCTYHRCCSGNGCNTDDATTHKMSALVLTAAAILALVFK